MKKYYRIIALVLTITIVSCNKEADTPQPVFSSLSSSSSQSYNFEGNGNLSGDLEGNWNIVVENNFRIGIPPVFSYNDTVDVNDYNVQYLPGFIYTNQGINPYIYQRTGNIIHYERPFIDPSTGNNIQDPVTGLWTTQIYDTILQVDQTTLMIKYDIDLGTSYSDGHLIKVYRRI